MTAPASTAIGPSIRIERHGAVGVLLMDRPERFNALDVRMAQDLRSAGLKLARDGEVRAVVLRGTGGKAFCSGADLKYIRGGGDGGDLAYLAPGDRPRTAGYGAIFKQILEYLHSTISEIRRSPKPWVAAVDGVAAAGGLGLAMSCDLVVCSARSSFEWAYAKTALCGAESSTFFLPRLVGFRRAMGMALLNPRLDAAQAREWGLVNEVYPTEQFDEEVLALAARLAALPTGSIAMTKALMNQAAGVDRLDWHLDQELESLARSADSADFAEGIDAFFGKRAARFQGK
ncbi:MAG TPA: enoyl-CoA hydratase-related protein [Anaeromyxobacteraceae bacterium]|nr:enoyl-CoA hydratase-related protein [Anaeromyxobacteraceae bacterium]